MTSKSLFCKLLKQDLKQRLWTIILASGVFLFLPIYTALLSEGNNNAYNYREISRFLCDNGWIGLITCVGAVICGLSGFAYLFSKKRVDFFHALPVRRELLFAVKYVNGILIYLVPYVTALLLSLFIAVTVGNEGADIIGKAFYWLFIHLTGYLMLYTTTVLAAMLTGNLGIAAALTGIFFAYSFLVNQLLQGYALTFFETYVSHHVLERDVVLWKWTSPVYLYISYLWEQKNPLLAYVKVYLLIFLLLALLLYLYRKRPSERAKSVFAFPVLSAPIRILLAVPAGLAFGLFLEEVSARHKPAWLLFGAAFGVLVTHMLLESFYHYDVRKCLAHKWQLAGTVLLAGAVAVCYQSDLTGFDSYFPREEKLAGVNILIDGLDGIWSGDYFSVTESEQDGEALHIVYEFAKLGKEAMTDEEPYTLSSVVSQKECMRTVRVVFELKSGRKAYRSYRLDMLSAKEQMELLFAKTDYVKAHFSRIFETTGEGLIEAETLVEGITKSYTLSVQEKEELLLALKADLAERTFQTILEEVPVARLHLQPFNLSNGISIYVYPCFERTLRFLRQHGLSTERRFAAESIQSIAVTDYRVYGDGADTAAVGQYPPKTTDGRTIVVTDKEKIARLYPLLVDSNMYGANRDLMPVESGIRCTVKGKTDEFGNYDWLNYFPLEGADLSFLYEE